MPQVSPSFVFEPNGQWHAAYTDEATQELRHAFELRDGGVADAVIDTSVLVARDPHAVIGPDGTLHVVYQSHNDVRYAHCP